MTVEPTEQDKEFEPLIGVIGQDGRVITQEEERENVERYRKRLKKGRRVIVAIIALVIVASLIVLLMK